MIILIPIIFLLLILYKIDYIDRFENEKCEKIK
jgi:hypothetical protein